MGVGLTPVYHSTARYLYRYDQEHDSAYSKALYCLLTHPQKQSVHKALHIHRNTLSYRIEKPESMVHISWDNHDALFSLALSCRLLRDFPPVENADSPTLI